MGHPNTRWDAQLWPPWWDPREVFAPDGGERGGAERMDDAQLSPVEREKEREGRERLLGKQLRSESGARN